MKGQKDMAIPVSVQHENLDEEAIFKKMYQEWGTAGSWNKIKKWYEKEHGVNLETGKAYTIPGLFQAAWRWALCNQNEAKEIYGSYLLQYGTNLTDELWEKTITTREETCKKRRR